MSSSADQTTRILMKMGKGDSAAADRLLPLVYDELRGLAAAHLARERVDHTLQPTALVHEAYMKLVGQTRADWKDRAHFFAVAAEAIRRVLVDHARKHKAQKRGSDWRKVTLHDSDGAAGEQTVDILTLDEALTKLKGLSERQCQVVQLRFFGGLTEQETAFLLGLHRSTVADDWAVAKAWLSTELTSSR